MRAIIILFALLASIGGRVYAEPNYELNRIKGSVELVDKRVKDHDLSGARFYTNTVRELMQSASAETRRDPSFAQLKQTIDRLEKELVVLEGGANKKALADEKMNAADSAARNAKSDVGYDEPEKALAGYKQCVALLEEAFAADPTARDRDVQGQKGRELDKSCRDGVIAAGKAASGEGRQKAGDTEEGKAAIAAFEAVTRAMEGKKLEQSVLVAGVHGMDDCRNKLGSLTGLMRRNGKHFYDQDTEKLTTSKGEITLADMDKRCAKAQLVLKTKTATGCGRKYFGVSQIRLVGGGWGPVETSPGPANAGYDGIPCSEMPKRSTLPGSTATFKAKYQTTCGANAIFVTGQSTWITNSDSRFIAGDCYSRGQLGFTK